MNHAEVSSEVQLPITVKGTNHLQKMPKKCQKGPKLQKSGEWV